MNKDYISALADALIKHGRRYGLSSTYRNHLIEILSAVPAPCCKSEACESPVDPVQEAARCIKEDLQIARHYKEAAEGRTRGLEAGSRLLGEVARELREVDPSLPKVIQSAVDAGKAAREALANLVPVSKTIPTPDVTADPDLYFKTGPAVETPMGDGKTIISRSVEIITNAATGVPGGTFAVVERDGGGISLVAPADVLGAPRDGGEPTLPPSDPVDVVSAVGEDPAPAPTAEFATVLPEAIPQPETAQDVILDKWHNTGGLPEGAPDAYKAASTPAVGFSITGLAQGKGTK